MRKTSPHAVPPAASSPASSIQPLAVDDREAARLLGVSSRTVWQLRQSGELPYRRIGRRCLISVEAIKAYLAIGGAK